MKTHEVTFCLLLSSILLTSCSGEKESESDPSGRRPTFTSEQKELADIRTGRLEYRLISSVISCTGEIEVPPHGMASVTAPLGGYIVTTDIVPGTYVRKGDVLARLSNPEYIALQQSYLETAGQMKFAEQEYARQKTLVEQNAAALKKLQETESSYNVLRARLAGLKGQLQMIGMNIPDLEQGNIRSEISLRAPLAGYVTEVNHHAGQFVEARETIFQIVDLSDLHLHLNVFEKDIVSIRRGQSVRFRPAGGGAEKYAGEISLVSPQRNPEIRTFDVHGHIRGEDDRLKPGMYVEAEILVSNDSSYAIHRSALVSSGKASYVVIEEGSDYRIVQVDTGVSMDGWVEIRNHEALRNKLIVTEGATRLFTALR